MWFSQRPALVSESSCVPWGTRGFKKMQDRKIYSFATSWRDGRRGRQRSTFSECNSTEETRSTKVVKLRYGKRDPRSSCGGKDVCTFCAGLLVPSVPAAKRTKFYPQNGSEFVLRCREIHKTAETPFYGHRKREEMPEAGGHPIPKSGLARKTSLFTLSRVFLDSTKVEEDDVVPLQPKKSRVYTGAPLIFNTTVVYDRRKKDRVLSLCLTDSFVQQYSNTTTTSLWRIG